MREAVIVSTARTPIGKAYRGAFNDTQAQELAAHALAHAVQRAGLEGGEVEDVILGCAVPQGSSGVNVARQAVLRAGLPDTVSGMSIDRQCSSGLMAIATAAKQIVGDGMQIAVGGGVESISLVQNDHMNTHRMTDPWLVERKPSIYLPMLHTAEIVAERYGVSRERQDEFALMSQQRTAAAQEAGRFDQEIVALDSVKKVLDKQSGEVRDEAVTLTRDEGNRASTTLEGLAGLAPVLPDGQVTAQSSVTAGNSSQLSDGASVSVLMESKEAERRGLEPLGVYRGMAVAGCAPDEMGIGPVFAIPKLLKQHNLTIDDIGLWELNEAFASQALYCRDELHIDPERFNVNGGAISAGSSPPVCCGLSPTSAPRSAATRACRWTSSAGTRHHAPSWPTTSAAVSTPEPSSEDSPNGSVPTVPTWRPRGSRPACRRECRSTGTCSRCSVISAPPAAPSRSCPIRSVPEPTTASTSPLWRMWSSSPPRSGSVSPPGGSTRSPAHASASPPRSQS